MKGSDPFIEQQYNRPHLYEAILERLQAQSLDLTQISRKDIAAVDEFHVRGAEVSKEIAQAHDLQGKYLLDVGCGIGGPCRMLADEFNCKVEGIDLNPEFIRTAQKLTSLVGLEDKIGFQVANALELPFEDNSFDVVWTQHVQMNIADKASLYAEIKRVLQSQGAFIYYDIFQGNNGPVDFPVPWADTSSISHLMSSRDLDKLLAELGFKRMETKDQTQAGIQFFLKVLERIKQFGPPSLGVGLLMGETAKVKLGNVLQGLQEDKIRLQSGVYTKA